MTTAENVKSLFDGGYIRQAIEMAMAESTTVNYLDAECLKVESYEFPDGSVFTL